MIITKYLVSEIFKNQLIILFILFFIFFSQKLVKVLSLVGKGDIPYNIILLLLCLNIPKIFQFILPFSIFFSVFITLGKLYNESEITAMYACGLNKIAFIRATMLLAIFTGIIALINVMWISPYFLYYQDNTLFKSKDNFNFLALKTGSFHQISNDGSILFIENFNGYYLNNIFYAQLYPKEKKHYSVVVADYGYLTQDKYGNKIITINNGMRFEGIKKTKDLFITSFKKHHILTYYKNNVLSLNNIEHMNINSLCNSHMNYRITTELNWRVALVYNIFVMTLVAIPLSEVNYRYGRLLSILIPTLLYILYFLLQIIIKSNAEQGKIHPIFWAWIVNIVYLLLAIALNFRDIMQLYYLRFKFYLKELFN